MQQGLIVNEEDQDTGGGAMSVYLVERIVPGATIDTITAIRHAAEDACRSFAIEGRSVRYLRSTFTPGESRCRCLFEARSSDLVQEVNEVAQIPFSRIILAVDLPAHGEDSHA